jgi:hypothetical protein
MARVRSDNDARYALRASFVDTNGDVITGDTITIDPGVSASQVANWDSAYNTVTAGSANWDSAYSTVTAGSANWDTAFGWGDHGSAGYYVNGSGGTTLDGAGNLYHANSIQCGISSSSPVGFTINDGGGNGNIVFNHFNNTVQTAGANTARIVHNTDSGSSSYLQFRVGSGGAAPVNKFEVREAYSSVLATGATAFRCSGDVVAYYSDRRLKDVSGAIESPLEKISALHGVYYTHNDKARELGYEGSERQVGLLAQDVQAVLPEVIQRAPIDMDPEGGSITGEDYITVNYQRIVPLLVEGIKALTAEVEELKEKLNAL